MTQQCYPEHRLFMFPVQDPSHMHLHSQACKMVVSHPHGCKMAYVHVSVGKKTENSTLFFVFK